MSNVNKEKETQVITNKELLGIIIIFSAILYFLFPGDKIFEYAINENKNLDLTKFYLKNIIKKYPYKNEAYFALTEIQIKLGEYQEAQKTISPLSFINDPEVKSKTRMYLSRISLRTLRMEKDEKIKKEKIKNIFDYYLSSDFKNSQNKQELLEELYLELSYLKEFELIKNLTFMFLKGDTFEIKKIAFLNYLKILRENNILKNEVNSFKNFEDIFLSDDETLVDLLKAYMESSKIDLARNLALKIMERKKIL